MSNYDTKPILCSAVRRTNPERQYKDTVFLLGNYDKGVEARIFRDYKKIYGIGHDETFINMELVKCYLADCIDKIVCDDKVKVSPLWVNENIQGRLR